MTVARLKAYRAYFMRHPPTHELVAMDVGYKFEAPASPRVQEDLPDRE